AEEEELRVEEEKKRIREKEKKKQEDEQKLSTEKDTSDDMVIETYERIIEDKGKAVASEHDPL
ncbi:hypothetical protein A2U01_0113485, partial [Trifolium medium]|nr:hypothetical protein [Trifolium medium]